MEYEYSIYGRFTNIPIPDFWHNTNGFVSKYHSILLRYVLIRFNICVNSNPVIVLNDISNFVMSGGILFEILILGINEMAYYVFPLKF